MAAVNSNEAVYREAKQELGLMRFHDNKFVKIVLRNNFGRLKAFVLENVVTMNYKISRFVCSKTIR